MLCIAFLSLLAAGQGEVAQTTTYRDDQLKLEFTHPKTWVIEKRQRDITTMSVPIEGSSDHATLQITRAEYRSEPEIWQLVQVQANKQLKREVVRQWEQQVLGVPMLLTKISYIESGVQVNTVTGLLYTATPKKLLFRLTAPTVDFDKVQYDFEQAMLTLRTLDDSQLQTEDPDKPTTKTKHKKDNAESAPDTKTRSVLADDQSKSRVIKAVATVEVPVSGRTLLVGLPKGWVVGAGEDGTVLLSHAKLSDKVQVRLFALADSDTPSDALAKASRQSLDAFKSITHREDLADQTTPTSLTLTTIWRFGKTADGDLVVLDAILVGQEHYAVVRYKTTNSRQADTAQGLLATLLKAISVAPKS